VPTYGYRCQSCGTEFDVWQRMSSEPIAACPVCGGAGKRLFFPAGIVFKGTGFYKTDSRKASPAESGSSAKDSPKSTTSSTTSSTPAAPATPSSSSDA